jgi:MFS family permease
MELWACEFGTYQWIQYVLQMLPAFCGGLHMLSQVPLGATPKHWCKVDNVSSVVEYVGFCHYISDDNETLPCQQWEYDRTFYESTIVTDWDLVCDRRWMAAVAQSIYMFGCIVASVTLGQISDRYGRWKVLVPTGILQMVFALGCAFVHNYVLYVILRFLIAVNANGAYMIGFVMTMEMTPDRYRTPIGISFQLMFALGIAAVAGWSFVFREWPTLQIVFAMHSSVLLLHWWLVDESPRWLFSQGKYQEAEQVVKKSLIRNGRSNLIPATGFSHEQMQTALGSSASTGECDHQMQQEQSPVKKYGLVDLFRTPLLRKRTFNICLNWFANSLAYYGLSLNTGALVGNPHLMLFISGIIEVPAYFVSIKLIDRLGRRPVISFCLILGGLACIVTTYLPQDSYTMTTITTTLVMLGKCLISVSFAVIYNYTAELFPTVVRSSAVGIGSTCARISGTLTPLIFLLDSLDPKLPSVLFGVVALTAGIFSLDLPETRNQPLLHTIQDGETFGAEDSIFRVLGGKFKPTHSMSLTSSKAQLQASVLTISSTKESIQ